MHRLIAAALHDPLAYVGIRESSGVRVVKISDGKVEDLNPRLDILRHSPTGFEWGYGGSGPAQLALAILADYQGEISALQDYHLFKRDVIAQLPHDEWLLSPSDIDRWIASACLPCPRVLLRTEDHGDIEVQVSIASYKAPASAAPVMPECYHRLSVDGRLNGWKGWVYPVLAVWACVGFLYAYAALFGGGHR